MEQRPTVRPRVDTYTPVFVRPLTSARHPAPPDSRIALYALLGAPSRPLEIGLAVHLYHLPPLGNSTAVSVGITGCIAGARACGTNEVEFVLKNDDHGGRIRRAFIRARVVPGVSANLDIAPDLSRRLEILAATLPPPSPPPVLPQVHFKYLDPQALPSAPYVATSTSESHAMEPGFLTRSNTGRYHFAPKTHYHPSSSLGDAMTPLDASRAMPPPPLPLPHSRAPSPPWLVAPRSPVPALERDSQDFLAPLGPQTSQVGVGRGRGAPTVDTSWDQIARLG